MKPRDRFIAACHRKAVDRPPVWIMRQAGRYLPEYRALRAKHSFGEICREPELVLEAALQPLRRFPLDAVILFSDIMVVPEAMGVRVEYADGGPQLHLKIESRDDIEALNDPDVGEALGYVGEALEAIRGEIGADMTLLGFSGAPYTLASYMVAGGGSGRGSAVKLMAYRNPEVLERLLERLSPVVSSYLRLQAVRGADALQLFDTWAGELSPSGFERFALPWVERIVADLRDLEVPIIYYTNGVAGLLPQISACDFDVLGVDWRISLDEVRRRTGNRFALQGNLDPRELFAPESHIRRRVREIHEEMGGRPGHIFNLGHGVCPDTPLEGVAAFVDEITRLGGGR